MKQHIIDTDELEKLPRYEQDKFLVRYEDVVKLIANSPQADDMVLEISDEKLQELITEHHPKAKKGVKRFEVTDWWRFGKAVSKAMLSAYKPQADDVPPDVYDIVVDTGDGIYHTAEVVHFQQSGSKRMIQVRLGDTQADDVRKDAEREWVPKFPVGSKVVFYQKHPESPLDKEPTFGTVESYYNWKTAECGEHYTIKMAVVDVDGIKIEVEHNCLLAIDKARE